jgi:alpha-D-ribose 1-methylphosphonate 5-triphosphate synthase subunit PhnG
MTRPIEDAATLVTRALARRAPAARTEFLRELMAHTAAGLVILEGERAAGEAVYRLGDAVVARGKVR